MGGALAMHLDDLAAEIRRRIGPEAEAIPEAAAEVVATVCRWWPCPAMTSIAQRGLQAGCEALDALAVIAAKVREDLELRYGMDATTQAALDLLVQITCVELANVWFASRGNRRMMRGCIAEARRNS